MSDQKPVEASKMSPRGTEIPKPGGQVPPEVLEAHQLVREERRTAERRIAEAKETARREVERIRSEAERRYTDLLQENKTLLKTLARTTIEKENVEQEIVHLKARLTLYENGHHAPSAWPSPAPVGGPATDGRGTVRGLPPGVVGPAPSPSGALVRLETRPSMPVPQRPGEAPADPPIPGALPVRLAEGPQAPASHGS